MAREVPAEDRLFGQLLVRQGVVTEAHVRDCLAEMTRRLEAGEPVPKLAELLVERGHLSAVHLQRTQRLDGGGETPRVASTFGTAPLVPPEVAEAAADPTKRIGKYVRLSSLGSGGMGEVWRGWDLELARPVALKFVRSDDADDLARLVREAQTAARLTHPGIAQVYDVGHHHDRPFIAMQLIDGRTLGDVVLRKPREAARAVRDAALAVQFAHDRGVLHRDLKPSNLMIDMGGRVYVLDFGLARTIGAQHSRSGIVVGTPVYMSPEQARAQTLTERSDVYSLGATLYELVAGRSLFPGTDAYELLRRVVDEDPPPLPHDVDRDLRLIIGKCLRKEPSERYASARELADDLDRYLDGREVRAHPPSAAYRVRKFVSRRRAVVATAAVAAVVVVALVLALRRPREDSLRELHGLWARALLARQGLYVAANDPARVRQDLRRAADDVAAYVARHPDQPQAHYVRARVLLDLGDLASAEDALRTSVRLASDFEPGHALLGRVLLERYVAILDGGRWETHNERVAAGRPVLAEARESMTKGAPRPGQDPALRWGLPRTPEDDVGDAVTRALAAAYLDDDKDAARRILNDATARAPAAEYANWLGHWTRTAEDKIRCQDEALSRMPHFARARFDRGRALHHLGREDEAIADFTAAITIDPRLASAFVARGNVRKAQGDFDGSIADFTEAIACDPAYVGAYVNRANTHNSCRRYAEAVRDCDAALKIAPDFSLAWTTRARARRMQGDTAGALADNRRAVEVAPASPGAHAGLADALAAAGDVEGCLREAAEALKLDAKYIPALVVRAYALMGRGDAAAAERDLDVAVAADPNHAVARGARGVARMRRGNHAGALEDLEVAYRRRERSLAFLSDLAWARLFTGDAAGARAVIDECLAAFPGEPEALIVRGVVKSQMGDHAAALVDLDEVIRKRPAWAAPYANRGLVRAAMRDEEGALADFNACLAIDPAQPSALSSRGKIRYFRRAWTEAIADFTAALKASPSDLQSLAYRGMCYGYVGEIDRQIADLEAALRLMPAGNPDRAKIEKMLAEARAKRGE